LSKQANPGWRYLELEAANFWRLSPGEFDSRAQNEKAEMLAFMWANRLMEAYHSEVAEKDAQAKKK